MTWDILIWLNDAAEPITLPTGRADRSEAEGELNELQSSVATGLANNVELVHVSWPDLADKGLTLAPTEVASMELVERA